MWMVGITDFRIWWDVRSVLLAVACFLVMSCAPESRINVVHSPSPNRYYSPFIGDWAPYTGGFQAWGVSISELNIQAEKYCRQFGGLNSSGVVPRGQDRSWHSSVTHKYGCNGPSAPASTRLASTTLAPSRPDQGTATSNSADLRSR